ncbi:MAG: hypothetical protein AAGG44_06575 [Planctomycetota bacterium]
MAREAMLDLPCLQMDDWQLIRPVTQVDSTGPLCRTPSTSGSRDPPLLAYA